MTQEIAVRTASKFLQQVYRDADIECHATILNAEANYLEGNKEGIKIITDALNGVKGFCDDLIVGMGGVSELWKDADDERLPPIDEEVVVLIQDNNDDHLHLRVAFGHRPNPRGWKVNVATGILEPFDVETYGKGGWNIPNVKWWLDVELPNVVRHESE